MANGLPSQVPSVPQTGGGKTYSEMVNEQLGLIQQQRAYNLERRLAQEEKNREFRTEQLQNIYDFDVTGLASGDVQVLSELQKRMADSLDPNSEQSYSDSRQLIADIAQLSNIYGYMKQWGQTRVAGSQGYSQLVTGQTEVGNGMMFTGDETTLAKRNEVWDQGAFSNVNITGGPGGWQITGDVLDPSGNTIETQVDFMQNSMRNRAEEFWRPEVTAATPYLDTVAAEYVGKTGIDPSKVAETAGVLFDADVRIYNRIVQDLYRQKVQEGVQMPPLSELLEGGQEGLAAYGLDEATVKSLYVAQAEIGVGLQARKVEQTPSVFTPSIVETSSGIGGYRINPDRPLELSSGQNLGIKVSGLAVSPSGDFIVTYMGPDKTPTELVIPRNSPDYTNIFRHIGTDGLEALVTLSQLGGGSGEEGGQQGTDPVYSLEQRTAERDRLVEVLGERFNEETGEDLSSYINTDSEPIEGRINVVSSLNNPDSVEGLYEIFIKEYRNQKEIQGRREERERQEREGIAPSITGFKAEGGGIIPRVRRFFGA